MEYNKIKEEAAVQEMILEKSWEAAQDGYYAIENGVVKGYKTVEGAVTGGYKKIENAFVDGYKKIENAFTETFMAKHNESC